MFPASTWTKIRDEDQGSDETGVRATINSYPETHPIQGYVEAGPETAYYGCCGRLKTSTFPVKMYTCAPCWFRVVLLTFTTA